MPYCKKHGNNSQKQPKNFALIVNIIQKIILTPLFVFVRSLVAQFLLQVQRILTQPYTKLLHLEVYGVVVPLIHTQVLSEFLVHTFLLCSSDPTQHPVLELPKRKKNSYVKLICEYI